MIQDTLDLPLGFVGPRAPKRPTVFGIDLFCGAGGSGIGLIEAAREDGYEPRVVCINHNRTSIQTNEANNPGMLHLCQGVDRVRPEVVIGKNRPLFLFGGPSCVYHSSARGGRPLNEQERAHAREFIRWVRKCRPDWVGCENVVRFIKWGPCRQKRDAQGNPIFLRVIVKGRKKKYVVATVPEEHRAKRKGESSQTWWRRLAALGFEPFLVPDEKRLGEYFHKFVRDLRRCGYDVEYRCLSAADFGAATNRIRFFLQAVRRDTKRKIFWPNPTHAKTVAGETGTHGLLGWRVAREVIDLSNWGTPLLSRKRPLVKNTMARIAYGFYTYALPELLGKIPGMSAAMPVRLRIKRPDGERLIDLKVEERPAPVRRTQTAGLSSGFVLPQQADGELAIGLDGPFRTITGKGAEAIVQSFLVSAAHGNDSLRIDENFRRTKSLDEPLGTITGSRDWAVCSAFIIPNFGERPNQTPRTHLLSEPLPTVTSHGAGGLVTVALAGALDAGGTHEILLEVGDRSWRVVFYYRMVAPKELSLAQGFPSDYEFHGTDTEIVKQIGNAVPPVLARALFLSYLRQTRDVGLPTGRLALERQRMAA